MACTQPVGTPASTTGDPSADVWVAGDSLAEGAGEAMTDVYNIAVGGATFSQGFTIHTRVMGALAAVVDRPETVVVIGGHNDLVHWGATPAEVVTEMARLVADVASTYPGTTVRLVTQPWWIHPAIGVVNDGIVADLAAIDCGAATWGSSDDDVHPDDFGPYAACIEAALR